MTYQQIYNIKDNKIELTLPIVFTNKKVMITIDDIAPAQFDKVALMKLAANAPMYLTDLNEVNDDFDGIEHEIL